MFLDDKLLKMVMDSDLSNHDEIQNTFANLCVECEIQYKSKLNNNSSDKQIKASLDRVFNSWESFIRMGKKINDIPKYKFILVLETHSFKKQFLADDTLRRIYNSL